MKKGLLLLLFAGMARAEEALPLVIQGSKTVQVDKVITIKVDVLVVDGPAFVVVGPETPLGKGLYFWQFPSTFTATDKGDKLDVSHAPNGSATVGLKLVTADLDKDGKFIGFVQKLYSQTVAVGGVEPPAPVLTELQKAMQAAYNTDPDPQKGMRVKLLAELMAHVVEAAKVDPAVKTNIDFTTKVHNATNTALENPAIPGSGAAALPTVRAAIGSYLNPILPRPSQPVSEDYWAMVTAAYAPVIEALKGLKQ